jgi:hypothetical protein
VAQTFISLQNMINANQNIRCLFKLSFIHDLNESRNYPIRNNWEGIAVPVDSPYESLNDWDTVLSTEAVALFRGWGCDSDERKPSMSSHWLRPGAFSEANAAFRRKVTPRRYRSAQPRRLLRFGPETPFKSVLG